ncbi:endonuclease MutS2 [Parvimonas micra]|uniref:endonuclease MutS2 n=1 Tax=Parvimonas micra TaxID=33033 RepID=UPI002003063D|nr:endonuclease MutS2 [Parvimonas micra]MCK6129911.1 endonuclease MutS2 [Parvimonas micra]MCK6135557.1 endonuclease MutS2 [Parvimonas micra]MCK6137029.1 endonuclease MutS2 [Parvimonas micra]MCK6153556.1 endonuclease MutS2 [Parvimonas micra]
MNNKVLKTLEFYKIINMLSDRSQSIIGKKVIKNSEVSTDMIEVQRLLDETDEAYRFIIKHRLPGISNIQDLEEDFKLLEIGQFFSPRKLLEVWKLLNTSRFLKNIISYDESLEFKNIFELLNSLNTAIQLERDLEISIISEDEISDDASSDLKRIRRMIKSKNDLIRDRLNQLISTSDKLMDNLYTLRDGRYVVPVRSEFKNSFKGIVHDQSASGQTVFIEPMFVVDLNNDLKKLEIDEEKEIERILMEFSKRVLEILPELISNLNVIANIDFIFSRGKLAYDVEAIKPIINNNGIISLKSARHPLIDKDKVVPIDISLGNSFNTLVITGPNTGGKTVTLKTVGILTLMTQYGLMIPCADNSEVAVFDELFADIGDEQSIEQSLSTFSSHMKNIIEIINNAKENSLILFDELGSGTDPEEGSGLSISILNYFLEKNIRTIATTHYSQLKMYAMTTENVQNAAMEFDVEKLEPTYKLIIGISGKSNAFEISKKLGLDESFIVNAKKFISNNELSFDKLVSNVDNRRKEYEELIIEQRKILSFNKKIKEEYEEKLEKFNKQKEKKIKKLDEYIENSIYETEKFCRETINHINKARSKEQSTKLKKISEEILKKIDKINHSKIIKKENESNILNEPLMLGEEVKVLSLNENGYVQTLPDKNGNLQVKIGILKVNANISDIIRIEKIVDHSKDKISYSKSNFIKSDKMFNNKIDVRGYNTEDAIYEIDKFLDDSFIANLNEVTIVHGKGTGVLRKNISDFLRKHKLVKSFSFGKFNEGGDGATVVKLK